MAEAVPMGAGAVDIAALPRECGGSRSLWGLDID